MPGIRRQARTIALQTLYEYDIAHHGPAEILRRHADERTLHPKVVEYANELVLGTCDHLADIDAHIQSAAREWPLQQMARIDKNILRLAAGGRSASAIASSTISRLRWPSTKLWNLPSLLAVMHPAVSSTESSVQYFIGPSNCPFQMPKVR